MENPKSKIWQYLQALPNNVGNAILGKPVPDVDSVDLSGVDTTTQEFKENAPVEIKVGNNPRIGGLLPDIASGYRENSSRPIEFSNLQAGLTPDGRNKGAAYRFGEFAGTAARLLDNPLVRGGIAYGLSKSMGDKRPLVEGLTAAVGTQQNRMKDQVYRNQLMALGMPEEEVNSIRGWIDGDTYKNVSDTFKARWNKTSWGDLANFNPKIQEVLKANPQLASVYVPASVANTILKGDLTDAQIANLLAQANLAGVKGKATMINANANKMRAESTKAVNDFILGNETPGTSGFVQMQAPDGKIYKVPTSKIQEMQSKGGKIIG